MKIIVSTILVLGVTGITPANATPVDSSTIHVSTVSGSAGIIR